jgi:hypothetical protein
MVIDVCCGYIYSAETGRKKKKKKKKKRCIVMHAVESVCAMCVCPGGCSSAR